MKKILMSLIMIVAVASVATGATKAYFSDEEISTGNTFAAGSLDLKVGDKDAPDVVALSFSNMKPGDSTGYKVWCLKNSGTISGKVSTVFSTINNVENGTNEPEDIAEAKPAIGFTEGELGQYLKRTVGWGPCNWTVPSTVISDWTTGPAHPWGTPALNGTGGQTFNYATALAPGQEIGFFLKLELASDLQRWDGTKWIDVDDNIIQSDGSSFDMTFRLDQVTP